MTGSQAARVRRQAAELLVRYLGGDMCIIEEVCALRGLQEELAAERPDDPRRIFGEAVDATGGTSSAAVTTQLVRACTQAIANAVPGIIDKLSAHIDELGPGPTASELERPRSQATIATRSTDFPGHCGRRATLSNSKISEYQRTRRPDLEGDSAKFCAYIWDARPSSEEKETKGGRASRSLC
jgi:hypothetical protein